MARKKTIAELRAENKILKTHRAGDVLAKVLNALIKWGFSAAMVYFAADAVKELAGKNTFADIAINAQAGTNEVVSTVYEVPGVYWWVLVLSVLVGLFGVLYGAHQAKLRRRLIARYSSEKIAEESEKDSKRSSSGLTHDGVTRPEDDV